jgi:hypothetical protein
MCFILVGSSYIEFDIVDRLLLAIHGEELD